MEQTIVSGQTAEDLKTEFKAPDLEAGVDEEVCVESWDYDLYMLVHSNQDVIVTCPWMDNAKVTLGDAMTTYEYPPNLTAEDEPFLISVVNELLDSRVIKNEEPEDLLIEDDEVEHVEEPDPIVVDSRVSAKDSGSVTTKKKPRPAQHVTKAHQPEKTSAHTMEPLRPKAPEAVVQAITSKPVANVPTEQVRSSRFHNSRR